MDANNTLRLMPLCLYSLVAVYPFGCAFGDSLTAELTKDRYYLFEPIVVKVTLQLDEPYRRVQNPVEATRQQRRLHHDLNAELRDSSGALCEATLGGVVFYPTENLVTECQVIIFGLLGRMIPERHESVFRFCEIPGCYTLVVVDQEYRWESNEIPITILAPTKEAKHAAELFESGGIGTWLALVGSQHGDRARPIFEQLAKDHPETIYGKYAKMALVLRRAENARTRRVKMTPGMWGALADDLKQAVVLFDPGHPLRSRALWYLARAERVPGVNGDPQETIRQLLSETNDGYSIHLAKEFLEERARIRRDTVRTARD